MSKIIKFSISRIKKLSNFGLIIIFYLIFSFNTANANNCYVGTPSCDLDGFQQCPSVQLQCDYGCELLFTSPGSSCPNGGDDCNNWSCIFEPVYGCTDSDASNYNSGATSDDGSCIYAEQPDAPEVSGDNWAIINEDKQFYVAANDPGGYQIRFGLDWSIPKDGIVDEWVPISGYLNSGSWRYVTHSWNFTGDTSFKTLTQNEWGTNSAWTKKEITVYPSEPHLVATPTSFTGGGEVDVSFDNVFQPTELDWIGVYKIGDENEVYSSWVYTATCSHDGGTPRENGTCQFSLPNETQDYNFRLFENDGFHIRATSNNVSVTSSADGGGPTFNVTVSVLQSLGGSIKSSDNVIDTKICGSPCVKSYAAGSEVALTAIPSSSYWQFSGWTGGSCSGEIICVINVGVDTEISASFVTRRFNYIEQ